MTVSRHDTHQRSIALLRSLRKSALAVRRFSNANDFWILNMLNKQGLVIIKRTAGVNYYHITELGLDYLLFEEL